MKIELGVMKPENKCDFINERSFLVELLKLKMFFTVDANTSIYNTTESVGRVAQSSIEIYSELYKKSFHLTFQHCQYLI